MPDKLSPLAPLPPLEYLQNQRRGSVTDPSLHAAPLSSLSKLNSLHRQSFDPLSNSSTSSSHHDSNFKNLINDPRPSSPYIFGDATTHSSTDGHAQLRKLLRSPSLENNKQRPSSALSHDSQETSRSATGPLNSKDSNQMHVDHDRQDYHSANRRIARESFDYTMRRHSIAPGQSPHTLPHLSTIPHGTKRKMSGDRAKFPPVGEEIDPQLVGPGVPSTGMDLDTEPPAPKRRGSAIDTQKIAQLSLNDRRNSVDSRGPSQWWTERRDSTSSGLSNISSMGGGFSPVITSSDSPHARIPPSTSFSWPSSQNTNDSPNQSNNTTHHNDSDTTNVANSSRSFESVGQMGMMPPSTFAHDRRMSMPDAFASSGPKRVLRSRSRPPSRTGHSADNNTQSGPSSGQEDMASAPSPSASNKAAKESGQTPYSRSPELRVSHKLAERKRRKEMKDLFDELRDQLPADRGMKASKWEILSKAIDFVAQLKQNHQDMAREIDMLRHEVDAMRQGGNPSFPLGCPPPHAVVYGQIPGQYPPPPGILQQQQQQQQQPPQHTSLPMQSIHSAPRPSSSQNIFTNAGQPSQNGDSHRNDTSPHT